MSVADASSERLLTPQEAREWWRVLKEVVATANGPFDLGVACADDPSLIPVVFRLLQENLVEDALINQPLLDIGRGTLLMGPNGPLKGYSLATVSEKVLGKELQKAGTPRLEYAHLDGVPFALWTHEQREYPKKDSRSTYDVVVEQKKGDPENDLGIRNLALAPYEVRAAFALQLMSAWGPRTDPEMVAEVVREVTEAHDSAIRDFTEAGIYRGEGWCRREKQCEGKAPHLAVPGCWKPWLPSKVGTKDGAWLAELVTRAFQGSPPPTESGGVSTDRDTLLESGDDLLEAFAKAGENETDYKTYLSVIERGKTLPICVRYDPIKRTARVGCRDPNLQNIPRNGKARQCFVPRNFRHEDVRERKVFCSTDYPSLELWTLAECCLDMMGESELARLLKSGMDLHLKLASLVLGISYEEAKARKKAGDPVIAAKRQDSKEVNYGLPGGMSEETLVLTARKKGTRFCLGAGAERCGVKKVIGTKGKAEGRPLCEACLQEAERFIEAWNEMLPEMADYKRLVQQEVAEGVVVVPSPEGLPSLYCAEKSLGAGMNKKFQGRAARLMKDAIWRVARACYLESENSPLFGTRPCMMIHDEVISEMPELLAHEAGFEQARLMGEALKTWCPKVGCDLSCPEPALERRWYKGAEKVMDKSGKLIPWWPKSWDWAPDQEIVNYDLQRRAA